MNSPDNSSRDSGPNKNGRSEDPLCSLLRLLAKAVARRVILAQQAQDTWPQAGPAAGNIENPRREGHQRPS
jgi:hypothetical protein